MNIQIFGTKKCNDTKKPVVRNGKQSTIGYHPDVWKGWS